MIDRDTLHVALWLRSNSQHLIRIHHMQLAAELGVGRSVISRTIARMIDEGRMKKIGHDYHSPQYRVVDPDTWTPEGP